MTVPQADNPKPELRTIEEVAALLRTSRTALYTQRHRGEPPGALGFLVGARVLWRQCDLDQWLEARATEARELAASR